eukprot:TRINITY_DN13466_c0_g1_i1.p1 TRINITY_DN13466_c0_g1~~TRINITY_DN13466_c0_g1_i1.p1  ORF type:complete len:408 (-),score=81.31 TRINITY_DN13466_c0_g1_i1:114-1220(-)
MAGGFMTAIALQPARKPCRGRRSAAASAARPLVLVLSVFVQLFASASAGILVPLHAPMMSSAPATSRSILDDDDMVSLAFVAYGADKYRSAARTAAHGAEAPAVPAAGAATTSGGDISMEVRADGSVEAAGAADAKWEAQFKYGVQHSKMALEVTASAEWVMDSKFSNAAVPVQILHAEELLHAGVSGAPEKVRNEKVAEQALRLYYHAKWLAERNYMRAAEWRYREAATLAKNCRRRVLASHALSRLGYFLMYWNRREEAREVLAESERLNTKSNALAPFLIGVLDRQVTDGDTEKLRAAEDRILSAAEQPSQELENDHRQLVREIKYWRQAEESARHCMDTQNFAHVLICFLGHAFNSLRKAAMRR